VHIPPPFSQTQKFILNLRERRNIQFSKSSSGEATKRQIIYLLVAIPGGEGMAYFSKNLSHKGTALSSRTIVFQNRPLLSLLLPQTLCGLGFNPA